MNINVNPSIAKGVVNAPPSKSMAHRMLICAALSEGRSRIDNIAFSQDILATLDCVKAMGAEVEIDGNVITMTGIGGKETLPPTTYMCRESGSTLRFFMGIAMAVGFDSTFCGSETLLGRPLSVYENICKDQGIEYSKEGQIHIKGQISPGDYVLPGNVSSQFISGLLFALPLLKADSRIIFNTNIESLSYIGLTIQALEMFGVKVNWSDEKTLFIPGNQKYKSCDTYVEGDYSNAAFLDVFNTMGGEVEVTGLKIDSIQGDRVYKEHFEALSKGQATVDIKDCPDLGPILFVVAALNYGGIFTGTARLKIKESDRGTVMCQELAKFGVETVMEEDRIEIKRCELHAPSQDIDGHNDHRIVMSFTTMLSKTGGKLFGAEAVRKSYPDYFDVIKGLGIEVETDGLDSK